MKNNSYVTFEVNGKNKKFKVLATFDYDDKTYIIYTDIKEKDNTLKTYAGIYNEQKNSVTPIKTDNEFKLVESFLNKVG